MNFKIFLVVCAVIIYEANAQGNSYPAGSQYPNEQRPLQSISYRNVRRPPYSSWITDPGVVYASQGGPITGLTYNILGLVGDGLRQITGGILGGITGTLQTLGQLGADLSYTLNPQSAAIVPPFAQPVPKDPEPVNARPPPPRPPQEREWTSRGNKQNFEDLQKLNNAVQKDLDAIKETSGQDPALNEIEGAEGRYIRNFIESRRLPLGPDDKVDLGRSELKPLK